MENIRHSGGSPQDHSSDRNLESKGQACEFQMGMRTRGHACYILQRPLSTFYPRPETLWEAMFKGDTLVYLVEETSAQPNIHGDCCLL
jgi:hypothetical protein